MTWCDNRSSGGSGLEFGIGIGTRRRMGRISFGSEELDYRTTSKEDLNHPAQHIPSHLIQLDRISDHRLCFYLNTRFTCRSEAIEARSSKQASMTCVVPDTSIQSSGRAERTRSGFEPGVSDTCRTITSGPVQVGPNHRISPSARRPVDSGAIVEQCD